MKEKNFFCRVFFSDDESDQTQEMTAIRLISKPSSADMTLNEQEESGATSNTPSAKVTTKLTNDTFVLITSCRITMSNSNEN